MSSRTVQPIDRPIEFWDQRHQARDEWTSGGDRGLSVGENREFYAIRLAMICRLIREYYSAERGLHILDGGCGRGHFTNSLRLFGHKAVGFDSSEMAVDYATSNFGKYFQLSTFETYQAALPFDIVMSIDVLFHILDDEIWEKSLIALANCGSSESLLLIADVFGDDSFTLGNYIVARSLQQYLEVLTPQGFEFVELVPYHFGSNPNSIGVFRQSRREKTCE